MTEFKDKNRKDLVNTLNEKKSSLQAFRFGGAGSKSRNVKEGRNTRKDIARILTELTAQTKAGAGSKLIDPVGDSAESGVKNK